jgi:circadian clock protein KaiB
MEAEFNLRSFCQAHLPGQHEIEIVDVLTKPYRALAEGVTLTPMLVKVSPAPTFKIVGRMNSFTVLFESLKMDGRKKGEA